MSLLVVSSESLVLLSGHAERGAEAHLSESLHLSHVVSELSSPEGSSQESVHLPHSVVEATSVTLHLLRMSWLWLGWFVR